MKNKHWLFVKIKPLPTGNPDNWTDAECLKFLSENWGLRGYNNTGITFHPENRNLETMRTECKTQQAILNTIKQ